MALLNQCAMRTEKNEWLGWRDSNPRVTESKSVALPLGDSPPFAPTLVFLGEPHKIFNNVRLYGDPSEIRTPDTLIKSQVLYRLS